MGRDKSFLVFRGKPLIQHVIESVSHLSDDLIITSNEPAKFANFSAKIVPDEYFGFGALAGIHSGLKAARYEMVFLVANDMPFININLFSYMEGLFLPGVDLVIPVSSKGFEPFHAIYRKSTCLPAVENAIKSNNKRIISWFDSVNIRQVEGKVLRELDPDDLAFINLNTPNDLDLFK